MSSEEVLNKKKEIKMSLENNRKFRKSFLKRKPKNNINKIISISNFEIQNNSICEEDDYNTKIYNKSLSKDKFLFSLYDEEKYNEIYCRYKTISTFNYIKKRIYEKSPFQEFKNNYDTNKKKINLNITYNERIKKEFILDDEFSILLNNDENYNNLKKNINIFNSIHKKKYIKINAKTKRKGKNQENVKKSKFSKKNKKKKIKTFIGFNNKNISGHKRNKTEYYLNLKSPQNKIMKMDKMNRISNVQKDDINNVINDTIPRQVSFNMYDTYIMDSNLEKKHTYTLKEKDMSIRESSIPNKSMKTIKIGITGSLIDENLNINQSKTKNISFNYNMTKNNQNHMHRKIKTINNYKSKGNNEKIKYIYKSKKKEEKGIHKIIRKRVVLEEEYMVSPEGKKKLLSIKRLDNGNKSYIYNSNNNSNGHILRKYMKKEKKNNKENKLINYKNNLSNSLYSSIFKDNIRQSDYNRVYLKSLEEDSKMISNITFLKNNKTNIIPQFDEEKSPKISKSIIANPSHFKNRNNKNINKTTKNLDIANNCKIENKNNSKIENKEANFKKKLFYNKIYLLKDKSINKFNKSNNNLDKTNRISSHTNFLNSNRISMNYGEDKEKSKMDSSRGIYERISFSKDQPYMIYHNEPQNPFVINDNKNCPNFVNIVFYNHQEQNNKLNKSGLNNYNVKQKEKLKYNNNNIYNKIDIPQPKSSYRSREIKTLSIDNASSPQCTRNYNQNNQNEANNSIRITYNNSFFNLNKNNNNDCNNDFNNDIIYSSMDNINNYYDFSEYINSGNGNIIDNIKDNFNKRIILNMSENSHY